MIPKNNTRGQWSSQFTFILAVIGSAVGLGNIWKFPYMVGESGGGAFILIYCLCVLLVLPIMTSEILIGRRGGLSPINSMGRLANDFGLSKAWKLVGAVGILGGFLILSYYSVIAGWTMGYFFRAGAGVFNELTADGVKTIFQLLIEDTERLLAWHTIFVLITTFVVARGIKIGIEKVITYSIPLLFLLLLFLLGYVMLEDSFMDSVRFMFTFDFSKVTAETVLLAMGQAFFSLSVGLGAIMVYGSYLPANVRIVRTAVSITVVDTVVAIIAGLIVFSLVFQYGLEPNEGPGLVFLTLPLAFGQMPAGEFVGAVFFMLLFLAAWTSAISLLEPAVAWACEEFKCSRSIAAGVAGLLVWILGIGAIFSFTHTEAWSIGNVSWFDAVDYVTSVILLPLGGAFIAIFAGWKLPAVVLREELNILHPWFYQIWKFLLKYVSPIAIFLIFFNQIKDTIIT